MIGEFHRIMLGHGVGQNVFYSEALWRDVSLCATISGPTIHWSDMLDNVHALSRESGVPTVREAAIGASEAAMMANRDSHIVITETLDRARGQRVGEPDGPLSGFTLAIKDMIDVAGCATTQGSSIYRDAVSDKTALCVERLEIQGAILVAKVNQHEFAYGVSSENPHWGDVLNVAYPELIPGGSSGGSAAAIAAGIARLSLGTDTAGSIRMPAACCGVVGLRPRTGIVPSDGVRGLAPSFDVVGPMAATVADVAMGWTALCPGSHAAPRGFDGLVVGVIEGTTMAEPLRALGAELRQFELPDDLLDVFWTVFRIEAAQTHRSTFPDRSDEYSANVRAKLSNALKTDPNEHASAVKALGELRLEVARRMDGIDLLVSATLGCPVPRVGSDEVAVRDDLGRLVAPFSALDLPALAIGNLQIIGRTEEDVLAAGLEWERVVGVIPLPC